MSTLRIISVAGLSIILGCAAPVRSETATLQAKAAYPSNPASRLELTTAPAVETPACNELTAQPNLLKVHFIDVGQGDCTLIECPGGQTILVDCGSSSPFANIDFDGIRSYVVGQLGTRTINGEERKWLDLLIITHPDKDHYNLLPFVLAPVRIGDAVLVGNTDDYTAKRISPDGQGEAVRKWVEGIDARGAAEWLDNDEVPYFDPLNQPSELCDCGPASLFVLAADVPAVRSGSNFEKNSLSIVLRVTLGEIDVVLTGDATWDTEDAILDRYTQNHSLALVSEVLKLGHHGSRATSTSAEWAEAISPKTAVVSASGKHYGHPAKDVIERISTYTTDHDQPHSITWGLYDDGFQYETVSGVEESIYSTGSNGTVVVVTNGQSYCVEYERNGP